MTLSTVKAIASEAITGVSPGFDLSTIMGNFPLKYTGSKIASSLAWLGTIVLGTASGANIFFSHSSVIGSGYTRISGPWAAPINIYRNLDLSTLLQFVRVEWDNTGGSATVSGLLFWKEKG